MADSTPNQVEAPATVRQGPARRITNYKPPNISLPDQLLPNPNFITVRPYPGDGSGLTAMLNYLLRERGNPEEFGSRGFYYLVKQYTETGRIVQEKDGEPFGFQLSEVMAAWQEHGLVPEGLWPDSPTGQDALTPEQAEVAGRYRPVSCQKVPKSVDALKAALVERHAVVAGFVVHDGWQKHVTDGVIGYKAKDGYPIVGGHAVAILGYTPQGFFIQNVWGPDWGGVTLGGHTYPGAALLTYPDFEEHYSGDGYVVTLPETLFVRSLLRRAGYASDTLEDQDRLDIARDVEAVCSVLAARDVKPPLALGLFGNWGTGKSFFMARMHEEIEALSRLERENPGQTPYCGEIVQIRFNAWHYLDANLWASLVSEIFERLFQAMADPQDTPEQTRRRVVRRLGEARGLYRQSRLELEQAKQEQALAQASLDEKKRQVETQKASLAELGDQLATLLANNPSVQQNINQLAARLDVPQLGQSLEVLQAQAREASTLSGRLRQIVRVIFNPNGRRDRLILLIGLLAGPPLIGALISTLSLALPGLLAEVSRVLNLTSGLLVSLIVLLTQLLRGNQVVDSLQSAVKQVERIQTERKTAIVQPQQARLDESAQAEKAAQARLDAAQQRVTALETELAELRPEHQVQAFIGERTSSEDYKKQLGLVSLVRRDFEKLSELMQTSAALEARWYERRRAALAAGKTFNQPKRRLLPLQRVILYIDDLDRCQPDRVIEVLEAVHLLLAFPLFVVVVAVDPRWLRQCLEIHYPHLLAMDTPRAGQEDGMREPSTPQDYLEKIFQLPFYLRPINDAGYRGLIAGLTANDLAAAATPPPAPVPGVDGQVPSQPVADGGTAPLSGTVRAGAGGAGQRAAQAAATRTARQAPPPDRLNPEQLKFTEWELRDMQRLSPLFRTPRAVKRFVNTYRLVRVSIPAAQLAAFEGRADQPGRYRVAQVLLAIISGYPNAAPRFLRRLLERSQGDKAATATWDHFLKECLDLPQAESQAAAEPEPGPKASRGATPAAGATAAGRAKTPPRKSGSRAAQRRQERQLAFYWQEWVQLIETLQRLSEGDFVPDKLSDYYDLVPRVARFSFSVSMLPE